MLIGEIVRGDAGFQMKVASVNDGVAECVSIDADGHIRIHHIDAKHLRRIVEVLACRGWWPDVNHVDEVAIIEEERRAKAAEKERKRKSKKAKPSKKLKRKSAA